METIITYTTLGLNYFGILSCKCVPMHSIPAVHTGI